MILLDLLPERSAEDVIAGRIRVRLGTGDEQVNIDLPVLPIRPERAWKELFERRLLDLWNGLDEQATPKAVLAYLGESGDLQRELLRAYDKSGALPADDWIDEHAVSTQITSILLGAAAAAYPLVEAAIDTVRRDPRLVGEMIQTIRNALSKSTNGVPASTVGRPARLKKT